MKRNGFTLIELLAVIVILAIIALIATPIILGIINDAREESNERSVELYASAIRNGIAAYQLREGKEVAVGLYTSETLPFDVEYDGEVECSTIELYEDGGVYVAGCTVNDLEVEYTYGTKQEEILCKSIAPIEQPIFEPSPWAMGSTVAGVQATPDAPYALGAVYSCNLGDGERTFYVLKEAGDNVKLIMSENLGGTVAWSVDGNNHINDSEDKQAVTAKTALAESTSEWTIPQNQITLLDVQDLQDVYMELPTWLYINLDGSSPYGYWTVSPINDSVWGVSIDGYLEQLNADAGNFGIRPVITILKSQLQ